MAITERDIKLLWARAAGRCSEPTCHEDLTPRLARSGSVVLGEMAHVIGRKRGAARSRTAVGTDDTYDNLILLCPTHHTIVDKAEADFPVQLLRKWKHDWESEVKRRLLPRMSAASGNALEMRLWAYFNFDLVLRLRKSLHPGPLDLPPDLWPNGVVDSDGFPLDGRDVSNQPRTVYDTWPLNRARALQRFYSGMVEQIIQTNPPLDLDDVWGIRKMRGLLYPSALAFLNRRCTLKTTRRTGEREERRVICQARGVKLTFQIDTWNAYSNSSLTLHFRGTSRIAALLLIRSIECSRDDGRSRLAVKATPVALGTGFWSAHDRTPAIAWRETDGDEYLGEVAP